MTADIALVILVATCTPTKVTQAEALLLATLVPNAIEAHQKLGAQTAAEWGEVQGAGEGRPGQRVVRVYATNATSTSSLIGYYAVDPETAEITQANEDLGTKPIQGAELKRTQSDIRHKHCIRP